MDEQELLKEKFKAAVSSAVKVISGQLNLEIKFGNNKNPKKNLLNLPEVINLRNVQDFTNLRAFADSEALKIKYTNKKIYLENEPKGTMAKVLYAIAEKIRYEKIGSDKLKGIKNNITQCYENKFKNKKIEEVKSEADVSISEAFELYLRSHFFKIKQNNTTKKVLSYWKNLFDKNLKIKLKTLDNCVKNQSEFSHIIVELINNLEFEDSDSKKKEEESEITKDDSLSKNNNEENNSTDSEKEKDQNDAEFNIVDSGIDSFNEDDNQNQSETKEVKGDPNLQKRSQKKLLKNKYKIFTNEYDEVKEAEDLENKDEIIRLRKNLDQQLLNLQNIVAKLANKLQRQLLAKQNRSWEFNL